MTGVETKIPTPEELEAMMGRGELKLLGAGSRRECYAIPGTQLCLKCYREEGAAPNATVAREIRKYRHDEKRNTCAEEYRYWLELKAKLPAYVFAAFPESLELIHLPTRGWAILESRVENDDGSACTRFSLSYRNADEATRTILLKEFWLLVGAFAAYGVRFYDTQNTVVQRRADNSFCLRVVDFEPAARTLIPIDSIFPCLIRGKVIRRAVRYLARHCGVKARYHGLKPALRRKWDTLIATEGTALGLADCVAFLENKQLNDIFYRGKFKGRPCVVKCSSKAPDSIANEYEMSLRLYKVDHRVVAQPLARWCSPDEKYAFVVLEYLPGPSLSQVRSQPLDHAARQRIAKDIMLIAEALVKAGIIWRDLIPNNFMRDSSGHFRLIDAQLAIDRSRPHECRFIRTNRFYQLLLFGYNRRLKGRGWCDADSLKAILQTLSLSDELSDELTRLNELSPQMTLLRKITFADMAYLSGVRIKLSVQRYLRKKENIAAIDERLDRINNFLEKSND